jgi:heme/copper-type cytochrome/quinol oxidase subunit 3
MMGAGVQTIVQREEYDDTIRQIPPGKMAIWWFLASEIMVFGGLIAAFVLFSFASHGAFAVDAKHVHWRLGAINTLVLVTSSLTMILALGYARAHNLARARLFLLLTVLLGLTFLGIKSIEYTTEIHEGFTPGTSLFWSFYFGMTGLHALHMIAGIVINSVLLIAALRKQPWDFLERRLELGGLYWHFVDVVWIFLFPLLYLT